MVAGPTMNETSPRHLIDASQDAELAFAPDLTCIVSCFGEVRLPLSFLSTPLTSSPFKAYEWNKMKTPTRILVGGPEVTSAFVLSALVHARKRMRH